MGFPSSNISLIQFVTRAVRVIDLITNLDMNGFQTHHGLNAFISRLDHEVNICRKEQPFVIRPTITTPASTTAISAGEGVNSMMDTTSEDASPRGEEEGGRASTQMTIDDHPEDHEPGKEYLTGV